MSHQEHFGRKFYLDKKRGYWISTTYPRIRAHRWVWQHYNGMIPASHHIHHIDKDKSNNSIENLELMVARNHLSLHASTPDRIRMSREWAEKNRPLTKAWHRSEEGRQWHRDHANKFKLGKWEPIDYICEQCDLSFKSSKLSGVRFCTNACKSKYRRLSLVDNVERICRRCNIKFEVNKYAKTKYCSRSCSHKAHRDKVNTQGR